MGTHGKVGAKRQYAEDTAPLGARFGRWTVTGHEKMGRRTAP